MIIVVDSEQMQAWKAVTGIFSADIPPGDRRPKWDSLKKHVYEYLAAFKSNDNRIANLTGSEEADSALVPSCTTHITIRPRGHGSHMRAHKHCYGVSRQSSYAN